MLNAQDAVAAAAGLEEQTPPPGVPDLKAEIARAIETYQRLAAQIENFPAALPRLSVVLLLTIP